LEILEINSALTVLPGALAGSMARPRNLMDRTITELAMPFLRTVDLGGLNNAINDSDLQMIMEDRYKIEYLNLDGACRITDDGVRVLIQKKTAWGHIGHNGYPRLKTLLLTGMRTLSDVGLGWCQAGCPNLEILDLSNCPLIGDWGLRSLGVMERVRVLRMKNCQMVTVSGVRMLLVNEKDRPTPISLVLEELDFSGCNKLETTGALGLVGSHVHRLRILKLDSCSIAEAIDDSAFSSVSGGCKNLQLLSLAQSRKKKKRAPANRQLPSLAEEADETHRSGKHIHHPRAAFVAPAYPSRDSITYLAENLSRTLTELDFSHLVNFSASGLEMLNTLRQLRKLSICGCERISDSALQFMPTWKIQDLNLSFNPQFTDRGLVYLAKCNEIKVLNVSFCKGLSDNGLNALCRTNLPNLTHLNAYGCDFVTTAGSLMGILNLKPVSYHLELVDELSKKMSSSSTGAKRSGYFGFRPIDTAVATEIQRAYKEEIISEKFAARKLQRNFRAYMVRIAFIRKTRAEKARRMKAATAIQTRFRGYIVRKHLAIEQYYKKLVAVRIQYCFRRKRAARNKKRALGFFIHGTQARAFAQWKFNVAEKARQRGEMSAQAYMKKALANYSEELKKKVFSAWTVYTWMQARRGRQLKKAMAFFCSNVQQRMFAIWGINAKTQRRKRRMYGDIFMLALPFKYHNRPELQEMKKKADNVLFTKLMRLHFDLWNKRCLEQRRYLRFRARRVYRTWCKVVIKHWGKAAHESGIEKRRFKQIFATLQRGKELRILLAWREYASDSKKGKRALGFLVHSTSIRIIAAWREFVSDQKQDRKRIQKAALTWVNMGKAKAIRKWFGFLQERRAYKRMIMRALNMMRNRALFQALDAFKEAIELKKNALLRAKHYFRNSILLKCYNALALEAAGRLDRIRAATLIQKRWRGKMYYDIYNKEKMEKIWAAEKIQSLYRGRKGRKKWTKKRRRKDLYAALECERETDLMEAEDKLSFLTRKETWAARTLQRHWRGKQQRLDFFFFKIAKSREGGLLYMEAQREARELARERQKERDELNNLKWLCAVRIQLWWRGPIKGRLFLKSLKLETLRNKKATLLQSVYRGRMGRNIAMAKRRMRGQRKLASTWRHSQGWVMRHLGFRHRHQQRFAYKFLRVLGLQPIEFNMVFWTQLNEIIHDYKVFKSKLGIEKEVLTTAIKRRTFKWSKSIRQKGEIKIAAWEKKTVAPHMACRIVRHRDKSLIGHTGYILNIDMSRGTHGMAEIKMDEDGSLKYVQVMTDGSASEAAMRGVIQTDPMAFISMPTTITKGWRLALRLWAEVEVKNSIEYKAARKIQTWIRQVLAIKYVILKSLEDKEKELRHRANNFDIFTRYNIPQNTRWRFFLATFMILRHGGKGNKKYKYYPEMPIRPFLPLELREWNVRRRRKGSVGNELAMIIQKRRAEVKEYRDANPNSDVPPFVRNPIKRWWRKRKARKVRRNEDRILQQMKVVEAQQIRNSKRKKEKFKKFERVGKAALSAGVEWNTKAKTKQDERKEISETLVRQLFDTFDTDGSGEIDTQEMQVLGYALGEVWDDEKVAKIMSEIDKDGSGAIDYQEFLNWFMSDTSLTGDRENTSQDPSDVQKIAFGLRMKLKRKIFLGKVRSWYRNSMKRLPKAFKASILSDMSRNSKQKRTKHVEKGRVETIEIIGGLGTCKHDGGISNIAQGDVVQIAGNHQTTEGEQRVVAALDPLTFTFYIDAEDTNYPHYQRGHVTRETTTEFDIVDISVAYGVARVSHAGGLDANGGDEIIVSGNSNEIDGKHTIEKIINATAFSFQVDSEDTNDDPHDGGKFSFVEGTVDQETKPVKKQAQLTEEGVKEEDFNANERKPVTLEQDLDVGNRRDDLIWADVWWFQQLTISKYVPGGGYCLVHGEWDKVKPVMKHLQRQNSTSEVTFKNLHEKAKNAMQSAKMAEAAKDEGGLEELAEALRLAELREQEGDKVGMGLWFAKLRRKLLERRLKQLRERRPKELPPKFMPNGAGMAIFPVQRNGWNMPGQDNTDDFGKLVVGEFCLNQIDIRDITYSHGLLHAFKSTLASEIATALRIPFYRVHIFGVDDATMYDQTFLEKQQTKVYGIRDSFRRPLSKKYNFVDDDMQKHFKQEEEDKAKVKELQRAEADIQKTEMRRNFDLVRDKAIHYYKIADTWVSKKSGRFEPFPDREVQIVASALRSRVKVKFHIDPPRNGMKEPDLKELRFDFMRQALKHRSRLRRTKVYLFKLSPMSLRMQIIGGNGSVGRLSYSATDAHGFEAGMGIVAAHSALTIVENQVRQEDIDRARLDRERHNRYLTATAAAARLKADIAQQELDKENATKVALEKKKREMERGIDGDEDWVNGNGKGINSIIDSTTGDAEETAILPETEATLEVGDQVATSNASASKVESVNIEEKTVDVGVKPPADEKAKPSTTETKSDVTTDDKSSTKIRLQGLKNVSGTLWKKLRTNVKSNSGDAYVDYRKFKTRRHHRTNWPQIHTLEGIFQHGIISGKVFITFHDKSKYSGQWVEALESRMEDHEGTWTTPDNISYTGKTIDNHFDSEHIKGEFFKVKYANGDIYEGPLLESRRTGFGVCKFANGSSYHGLWFEDRRHGMGRMFVPDEKIGGTAEYHGPWRHDKKHGFGSETFPDGSTYEGWFFQDLWHGQGMRYFANGDVYTGDFKNGRMWGEGTYDYHDGRQYKGDFVHDKREGIGILTYPRVSASKGKAKVLMGDHTIARSISASRGPGTSADPDEDPFKPETRTADRHNRGVMALRGDWGPLGAERYEGPFVNNHEHGEGLWIVPTSDHFEERRYGVWTDGERQRWLTMPANEEQSNGFVEMFTDEAAFHGIQAAMLARFLPHLPPGVNGADPAVKLVANGILRHNKTIAGDAVVLEAQEKLVSATEECNKAEDQYYYWRDILEDAQETLEEQMDVVQAVRDNERDIRQDIWKYEKEIKDHWEHQPRDFQGRYKRAVDWINRIQLKSWHKARAVIKPRAPVHLIYEAICIMLDKPIKMEESIRLLNDRHLNVKSGDRESITREYDVKLKDIIKRGEFKYYDLNKKRGESKDNKYQNVWKLRPYVENIEFRADNAKFDAVADCLCALVEWVLASYKCAVYALPIMKHREQIHKLEVNLNLVIKDLKEELSEVAILQKEYDNALKSFDAAQSEYTLRRKRKNDLIEKLRVVNLMKECGKIPNIARDWELPNLRTDEPYQAHSKDVSLVLAELNADTKRKEEEKR
jgi:hypothetical protein